MRTDYKNPLNLSNLWQKKLCDFASNFVTQITNSAFYIAKAKAVLIP